MTPLAIHRVYIADIPPLCLDKVSDQGVRVIDGVTITREIHYLEQMEVPLFIPTRRRNTTLDFANGSHAWEVRLGIRNGRNGYGIDFDGLLTHEPIPSRE
jgi:hypothetical protein